MRYRTIVADPPWRYADGFGSPGSAAFVQGRKRLPHEIGAISTKALPYPSLTVQEMSKMPVKDLADRDARLFLWATSRYLPDAFGVVDAWGFAYRQTLVWDKTPSHSPIGGSVAPNAAEFVLVATRGAPATLKRWAGSVINAPRPWRSHSAKPEVFLDLVEQVSPGPYLELFARRQRLGWDTWGDEALEHVELPA